MSEQRSLHVWTDEAGCVVAATSTEEPTSAALPHVHWVEPDLVIEADGVDPDRFVRITATLDGSDSSSGRPGSDRLRLVERMLGVERAALDAVGPRPTAVTVDEERLAELGRLAAVGASRDASRTTGARSPWWGVEAHAIASRLACPELGFGDPTDLLDQVSAQRWLDLAAVAEPARAGLALVAAAADRPVPTFDVHPADPADVDDGLEAHQREVGVLPPLMPGAAVQVPISPADAEPDVFDLDDGARVALSDDGRAVEVAVAVAEGAYLQRARRHRVQVQRLDVDLIVGESALEARGPDRVAAEIRLSAFSRRRPLALRLFPQEQTTTPTREVVVARAASAQATAGAALARLGRPDAAAEAFARAAGWWRSIDQEGAAEAAAAAASTAADLGSVPALLGEALQPDAP